MGIMTQRTYSVGCPCQCFPSQELEGDPQVGEGDEFDWRVGAKRVRKSTTGTFSNALGSRRQQHNTTRFDQVFQMKAVTHATFIDVR